MPVTVEPVRLKPFLGMPPGVYLTILYALGIMIILFLIGFLPGIIKSGKRVTFVSPVEPAAVYVDGRYAGSAPVTVFIEPGTHEVVYAFEDAASATIDVEISHPVFFTWLFPRRQTVASGNFIDDIPAFSKYLDSMGAQIVRWSAITDYDEQYHYPPLFTQVARTAFASDLSEVPSLIAKFMKGGFRHISGPSLLADATEAVRILADGGTIDSSTRADLERHLASVESLFNPGASAETVGLAPQTFTGTVRSATLDDPNGALPSILGFSYVGGSVVVGEPVAATYPDVTRMGILREVGPFAISALEISEYQWAVFMEANPYWAKANIDRLIADGMVDSSYLAGLYPSSAVLSTRPIHNISWYAADAFTRWLSDISGKRVSLPSEAQWELAASSVSHKGYQTQSVSLAESSGPSGMLGGYWEFTSDPFIPLDRYLGITGGWECEATDIVVKGGSYLNDPDRINRATVGVLGRDECSETAGFRIVWNGK